MRSRQAGVGGALNDELVGEGDVGRTVHTVVGQVACGRPLARAQYGLVRVSGVIDVAKTQVRLGEGDVPGVAVDAGYSVSGVGLLPRRRGR